MGHHPVRSYSAKHGSQLELARLDAVMRARGVALFLNGHDHNLQTIQEATPSEAGDEARRLREAAEAHGATASTSAGARGISS